MSPKNLSARAAEARLGHAIRYNGAPSQDISADDCTHFPSSRPLGGVYSLIVARQTPGLALNVESDASATGKVMHCDMTKLEILCT